MRKGSRGAAGLLGEEEHVTGMASVAGLVSFNASAISMTCEGVEPWHSISTGTQVHCCIMPHACLQQQRCNEGRTAAALTGSCSRSAAAFAVSSTWRWTGSDQLVSCHSKLPPIAPRLLLQLALPKTLRHRTNTCT